MYESRHQSHHAWATFCSTVFETAPLVTCKSKSNRKSRLTNSTLVSYQGHINSCWIQPSPHHRPSSDVHMELYGVRTTVQKSGRYPRLCFSSLHCPSCTRYFLGAVWSWGSPALCIHIFFSRSLNSAQSHFCLQHPSLCSDPYLEPPRENMGLSFLPNISLEVGRRSCWRL